MPDLKTTSVQISVGTAHPVRSGGRPAVPGARGWGQGNPLRFGARGWGFLAVPTEICSSQLRSGSWDLELAVQVRQCLLRSGVRSWGPAWGLEPAVETRSWGPAVPTEMCSLQLMSGSAHWDLELAVGREEDGGGRRKEEEEDGRRQATFMNSITWQVGNIIYIDRRIKEKQLSFQPSETSGDRIMELIWLTQNDPCGGQRLLQQRMSITSREPWIV